MVYPAHVYSAHERDFNKRIDDALLDAEQLAEDEEWCPEPEPFVDWDELERQKHKRARVPTALLPSEFTEFAFRIVREDGQGYAPFSFEGRRHMRQIYDTPAKRILLFCARQVEKSTLLGNSAITYSCLVQGHKTLYVSPSATQTKTFSGDRIKDPLETSNVLRSFTTTALAQNVFEKQFVNRSKITLRYAFLNADRTRGIPAYRLLIDEFQDIVSDNIPIIEQCTSHAPEEWKRFIYAGTPKSLDNNLENYRANKSTQGEWVVPCDKHGGETGRYWNILGEKNIGKKGLICEKCGSGIDAMTPDAQWAHQVAYDPVYTPFESYRIPQLMVPWKDWSSLLLDYNQYSRDRFYNEVLGISFDSGLRPLTRAQVRACCKDNVRMSAEGLDFYRNFSVSSNVYAGVDWGTGENSYTVVTLGTYVDVKFRIFYIHRFEGEGVDPEIQIQQLIELFKHFNVKIIGADYGGGHYMNDRLTRVFGPQRLQKYQYAARVKKKIMYNKEHRRWIMQRTDVMSDIFNAIKRQQFEFPRWAEFRDIYGQDMLNIFSEYNKSLRMIQYSHRKDKPDDSLHSLLYCFLASMIMQPRPDIIAPIKEDGRRGPLRSSYSGPTDQS